MLTSKNTQQILHQETRWLLWIAPLIMLNLVSGSINALIGEQFYIWQQVNLLLHIIIGSVTLLPFFVYLYTHAKRTLGVRSLWLTITGFIPVFVMLGLFWSGLQLAIHGQQEHSAFFTNYHGLFASLFLLLIMLHLLLHGLAKKSKQTPFLTLQRQNIILLCLALLIYASVLLLLTAIYTAFHDEIQPPVIDYQYDYGNHPFRPSQTETQSGGFVLTEQIAQSAQCGTCHQDIYQQWLSSAHRQAASDPAYVKNINLLEATRGITATRYCEGCHAPVALLTGQLTPGGKHGGVPDTPAHLEGVGCLACHGIDKVVHTNGVGSFQFSPKDHYLFSSQHHQLAQTLRHLLIRLNPDQHKADMGSSLMQDPTLCATCHEQFMDESMNHWGWVKMQSEYHDWLNSPFSGQNDQAFKTEESLTCQNCHFPLVAGSDPSADANGMIHSHRSLGANTVLPLLAGDQEQLQATIDFLQNAKVVVSIEQPNRQDTVYNHQTLHQTLRHTEYDNTPYFLYLGEQATLTVAVTNRMVGHNFPGGTTDINQAWLAFEVKDGNGEIIYHSGYLDDNYELDKQAHTYHSVPVDRHGKAVWRHDLFRMTGDAYKNVIPSGKTDIKSYTFTVPAWAKNPLTVNAKVKYRKFNQRYARWALKHPKPVLPIVDMARDTLTIPLKVKPVLIEP